MMDARELHLRIGRLTIAAPAGADRHALARELAAQLPDAIVQHLRAGDSAGGADPTTLHDRIAAAVVPRVSARLEAQR